MEEQAQINIFYHRCAMKYRRMIDQYTIYPGQRWAFTLLCVLLYIYRIVVTQSYFVVSYILGLFVMQSALRYFTPLGLPDVEDEDEEYEVSLPHSLEISNDRPLLRSMSEVSLWESISQAILFGVLASFIQVFDLPVYWPFLFCYFIMLVLMTFKRYLKHMHKYGYKLSDFGKSQNRSNQR